MKKETKYAKELRQMIVKSGRSRKWISAQLDGMNRMTFWRKANEKHGCSFTTEEKKQIAKLLKP